MFKNAKQLQTLSSYYSQVSRLSAVLVEIKRCGCTSRQILNLLKAKIVLWGGGTNLSQTRSPLGTLACLSLFPLPDSLDFSLEDVLLQGKFWFRWTK